MQAESVLSALRNDSPSKDDRQILTYQFKGYLIHVGQNSYSNERMISEHGHSDCLWMHATAARGSHVILCVQGKDDPLEDVLQYAARLALKFSHSETRSVSVAFLKDVCKREGDSVGVFKPSRKTLMDVP